MGLLSSNPVHSDAHLLGVRSVISSRRLNRPMTRSERSFSGWSESAQIGSFQGSDLGSQKQLRLAHFGGQKSTQKGGISGVEISPNRVISRVQKEVKKGHFRDFRDPPGTK